MRRGLIGALVLVAFAGAIGPNMSARAAFPGRNGNLAFASGANIWVMDPGGGKPKKITGGEFESSEPDWSPDGDRILFICNGGYYSHANKNEICTMSSNGRDRVKITSDNKGEGSPTWSPDASRIAFSRTDCMDWEKCPLQVFVMNIDGSGTRQISEGDHAYDPVWSPTGNEIAYVQDCDIFITDADGANTRNVTPERGTSTLGSDNPCEMAPEWSPDGKSIAYMCLSDTEPYCGTSWWNIWVMNADGSDKVQVTEDPGGLSPAWSPNGKRICFDDGEHNRISTIRVDGTGLKRLTSKDGKSFYSCDWQPV